MRSHWTVALVGWFLFMTWLSHQSGPKTAEESRALARELQPLLPGRYPEAINCLLRKAAHVLVFAVLAILASGAAVAPGTSAPPAWVYGLLVVWCWGDEATKLLVPGRHFSWLDVGLNGAGVVLGSLLRMALWYKI